MMLDKLQGQVVTHSQQVVWWRILMVECVKSLAILVILDFLQNSFKSWNISPHPLKP